MVVGDSEVDVQTARNAGTMAAAVNYGFGVHDRAQHPADIYLDRISRSACLTGRLGRTDPSGTPADPNYRVSRGRPANTPRQ